MGEAGRGRHYCRGIVCKEPLREDADLKKTAFTSHPTPGKPASFRGPLGATRLHIQRAVLSSADTQDIKDPGGNHHDQEIDG